MFTLIAAIFLAFLYRFRGGGFITTGNDTICRFAWGGGLALASLLLGGVSDPELIFAASSIVLGYLTMVLVPHGFCQDDGTNANPPQVGKPALWQRWPAALLPQWTVAGWQVAPKWQKTAYDAAQMGCVGFFRGLLVFVPKAALTGKWFGAVLAILTITVLQPLSYFLGYLVPVSFPSLAAKSSEWAEFLNGASWAVALAVSEV